jgi:inorganic triphosphatase YgiF
LQIAAIHLGSIEEHINHDTYYDTPSRSLSSKDASLRIRNKNDADLFVTLKTKNVEDAVSEKQSLGEAVFSRNEIEGVANVETLREIHAKLMELGIISKEFDPLALPQIGVKGVFLSWGFVELFSLDNNRTTRPLVHVDGTRIGEIAVDRVCYSGDHKQSFIYEMELESGGSNLAVLAEVADELHRHFRDAFGPSKKSKYQTGLEFIGVEEHNKIELKLIVPGESSKVLDQLKMEARIAEYELGTASEYDLEDEYFDTDNFNLWRSSCYVRLRNEGGHLVVTLRRYQLTAGSQMIETLQMKHPATTEFLQRIIEYLVEEKLIARPRNRIYTSGTPHDVLVAVGLYPKLDVHIRRVVFPISHQDRRFGSVKFDRVKFQSAGESCDHSEIEISTSRSENLTELQAAAFILISKFELKPTRRPKYDIGLRLVRGETIENGYAAHGSSGLSIYSRNDASAQHIIERQAKRLVKRDLLISSASLIIVVLTLFVATLMRSWELVEPWTYFFGLLPIILAYVYFSFTTKSLNPEEMYDKMIQRHKSKIEKDFEDRL